MPGIDEEKNTWKVRQVPPALFDPSTFYTVSISPGIMLVNGKRLDDNKTAVQTILFDKENYPDKKNVIAWIKEHPEYKYNEAEKINYESFISEFTNIPVRGTFTEYQIYPKPIQNDDDTLPHIPSKVFVAREGQFIHRRGITKQDLVEIVENFKNRVTGLDTDFDYDHKEDIAKGRKAAGWVRDIEFQDMYVDGQIKQALFASPEWTPEAAKAIQEREYRYTSPELVFNWTHPETGKKYGTVLRSVAILNKPQFPNQPALSLKEVTADANTKKESEENKKMDKFFKELLGKNSVKFSDSDSDEVISAKFKDFVEGVIAEKEALKVKFAEVETAKAEAIKAKETAETELNKFKEAEVKATVERLCEKAITKMPKAKIDGWFREYATKDVVSAEKYLELTPDAEFNKGTGTGNGNGETKDADTKFHEAVVEERERLAKERGITDVNAKYSLTAEASINVSEKFKEKEKK